MGKNNQGLLMCIRKKEHRLPRNEGADVGKNDQVKAIFHAHQTSSNAMTVLMTLAYFL